MKLKLMAVLAFCLVLGASADAQSRKKPKLQTATVTIDQKGYSRTSIILRNGVPTRLTFLRQTDETCATEVVIPEYGISRPLPLNTPTAVAFTPTRSGEFNFTCGMNMMRGKLVVQ